MSTKLFLDDERHPPDDGSDWVIVRSSLEAIHYCTSIEHVPSYVSFDHDLGGDDSAMKFVHWMVEMDLDEPGFIPEDFSFYVHSQNPIGATNIDKYLTGYLRYREMLVKGE